MQKVSIIIPTFNSIKYLQETLESVLLQDYPHFECILVDDGSSDKTQDLITGFLKKDNRFQFYKRPDELPKGPSSCRNYGVEKAKGDYIIFLDADDLLALDCLKNRVAEFNKNQDHDFLVFQMERFIHQPDFSKRAKETEMDKNVILQSFLHLHSQWPITAPIYKATFFKGIGFNQKLVVFEDLEVAIKSIILSSGFKVFETIDCYYRNDANYKTKYNSIEVKTRMIKGFQAFLGCISELIRHNPETHFKNENIKLYLVESYKKIFRSIILDNSKIFRNDNKKIIQFLSNHKLINNTEILQFQFVHLVLMPFVTIKGSGMARLTQFFYR